MSAMTLVIVLLVVISVAIAAVLATVAVSSFVQSRRLRQQPSLGDVRMAIITAASPVRTPPSTEELSRLNGLSERYIVSVMLDLAPSFSGSSRTILVSLAEELGVLERARKGVRRRRWPNRLYSARVLTAFGVESEDLYGLLVDRSPEVRAQAAAWCVVTPNRVAVDHLIRLLDDPNGQCRFAAQDALIRIGLPASQGLIDALADSNEVSTRRLLAVARSMADDRLYDRALALTGDPSPQTRALAVAVLARIGNTDAGPTLTTLLEDPSEDVILAAAAGLAKLAFWRGAPAVERLLSHPSWDVRKQAVLALLAMGEPGGILLRANQPGSGPGGRDVHPGSATAGPSHGGSRVMRHFYIDYLRPINYVVLVYFAALAAFYLVLYVSAALEMRTYLRRVRAEQYHEILSSEIAPSISMLVPAYNEETSIQQSVRALLTVAYPQLEIVVVNDGSTDGTLAVLASTFDLVPIEPLYDRRIATEEVQSIYRSRHFPNLVVVSKEKGGKADALNAGLNVSSGELVCSIDADTILDPDGLRRLVRPFIRSDDVVAAGATIRVANGCTVAQGRLATERGPHRALAGIQAVEYLRAFLFGRPGWNRLGGNLLISGAFGLFRRQSLLETDGYAKTVGEDMELVVRLRRHSYETGHPARVEFVPDPVAWTETPTSFRELGRQRERWQRGFSDVLWRHRRLMLNPHYGVLGLVVFPAFVLFEWMAPIIEAVGLVVVVVGLVLGEVSATFAVLFFSLACGLGILLSMLALMLEELSFRRYGRARDRALLVLWAVLENLGYRQLTVWWRMRGNASYLRGKKAWGKMNRKGFKPADGPETTLGELYPPTPSVQGGPVGVAAFRLTPGATLPIRAKRVEPGFQMAKPLL